ncbi:MAG: sulfite exporter TauE/SafE family protein [Halothece sp.]
MLTFIIGHLLAVLIGISLGLIGGGGSILAVPILIYVMGLEAKEAIAMSLVIVGCVSLIGLIPHWRQGNVNFKTALVFTPPAMLGAYLGARLAAFPFVTDTVQLLSFGVMMVLASFLMIRNKKTSVKAESTDSSSHQNIWQKWILVPVEGLGVGILTGFVGIGGGFAIIPALVLLGGIPMKEAIGTSLLIIAFKSATGFLGYVNQITVDWNLLISFTIAAGIGTIAGAKLTEYIDAKQLQKGFGYFVLAVAAFVLFQH